MRAVTILLLVACESAPTKPAPPTPAPAPTPAPKPPVPDSPPDPRTACNACAADQMCVQRFGGTCQLMAIECVPKVANVECRTDACAPACEQAFCPEPFQCQNRVPCPDENAAAFRCYGP